MMLVSIVFGMASSVVFDIHPLHGLFVAACLALSSTPLVSRFLESKYSILGSRDYKVLYRGGLESRR